jgi:hypothetical protein
MENARTLAPMTRRRLPLWLLRDALALAGVLATLFLLVATLHYHAFIRRKPTTPTQRAHLFSLLANAETFFDFALMREAYRRLGFNHRVLKPSPYEPPTTLAAFDQRFQAWLRCAENLDHFANIATEEVRRTYRIARRCPLRRAARATSPVLRTEEETHRARGNRRRLSSSGQRPGEVARARFARDGGGSRRLAFNALPRAPPKIPYSPFPTPHSLAAEPQRDRPLMSKTQKAHLAVRPVFSALHISL